LVGEEPGGKGAGYCRAGTWYLQGGGYGRSVRRRVAENDFERLLSELDYEVSEEDVVYEISKFAGKGKYRWGWGQG
jgi:hypothetical protein